jgi:hypothetical protein
MGFVPPSSRDTSMPTTNTTIAATSSMPNDHQPIAMSR